MALWAWQGKRLETPPAEAGKTDGGGQCIKAAEKHPRRGGEDSL